MSRFNYYNMIAQAGYSFVWDRINSDNIQPLRHEIRDMIIGSDVIKAKIIGENSPHLWSWER